MKQVIEIFKQLQNTSGKKDKEAIIAANKDNVLFKECLIFLLDTNVQTGIAKKSLQKKIKTDKRIIVLPHWANCMDYFRRHNTGRDYDILVAQAFINSQNEEDRWFYSEMITKSLKCGVNVTTANKVIPNLIFEWKVQLGSPQDKLKLKKGEKFFLSRKANGTRCSYMNGRLISRQGKEFTGMSHIIDDINKLNLDTYFIDGELIRKNVDDIDDNLNFRLGTGIINSDVTDKSEIEFVIFDIFPIETINGDKTIEKYSVRKQRMQDIEKIIAQTGVENLKIIEMVYEGSDTDEIDKWLKYGNEHNWEGCMLNKNTPYEFKRTTNLIKIKSFHTCDLKIIGYKEGQGRNVGVLGAFVVDYKGNRLEIGSGFSDEERKNFWTNREDMIGKIIQVKYKDVSKNSKTGLESLQFATFECVRNDKTEASYD